MQKVLLTLISLLLIIKPILAENQPIEINRYAQTVSDKEILNKVEYISNDLTKGRLTGTFGNMITASYLRHFFTKYGLSKFYSQSYTQSFKVDSTTIGRNIIGVIPSKYYSDEYILISAHYDHLGIIGGSIYNGADDNASGVAAVLTMIELFSKMRLEREGPAKNILIALYDAKENSMAGSKYFFDNLPIDPSKIKYSINIDQIGCTFSPPGNNSEYILYLASKNIRYEIRRRIDMLNNFYKINLDIDHSFYDSPAFYELFFRTSDQINSHNAGIPSIMFTSGIHMHTYKPTDRYYFIDSNVLAKRVQLIFMLTDHLSRYYR